MAAIQTSYVTNATALFDMFEDIAETPAHMFNYGVLMNWFSLTSHQVQIIDGEIGFGQGTFVFEDNNKIIINADHTYAFTRSDITSDDTLVMDDAHKV